MTKIAVIRSDDEEVELNIMSDAIYTIIDLSLEAALDLSKSLYEQATRKKVGCRG